MNTEEEDCKFPTGYKEAAECLADYTYPKNDELKKDTVLQGEVRACNFENEKESQNIINEIVLWKIDRQVKIKTDLLRRIKAFSKAYDTPQSFREKIDSEEFKGILRELLNSIGVRIPVASTILKMFNPNVFPIIDKRAYHAMSIGKGNVAILKDYSQSKKGIEDSIQTYLDYVKDCYNFYDNVMERKGEFWKVDQILYQWDKDAGYDLKGNKKKKRAKK